MGQEIGKCQFSEAEFEGFRSRLQEETALLAKMLCAGAFSSGGPITGFELEAWLTDENMNPLPVNAEFLRRFGRSLACPELAKFNVEFNNVPQPLNGDVLSKLRAELEDIRSRADETAGELGGNLLLIGILPTLTEAVLNLENLSDLNRFRALNEQILGARKRRPVRLDISGSQHLKTEHGDVMLEAATTSFQIHLQVPQDCIKPYFNAAIQVSAFMVAVSANSPFLFGRDLWAETRIPLFEQAIGVGGYRDAAHGPLHRVGFGSSYVHGGIEEIFEENYQHFPILLPILFGTSTARFAHLRLHNGTIWRWNRPLIGFDPDGLPHVRIEHRVIPAGPTVIDMIANAAFFYGLAESLVAERDETIVPFPQARDNFYQAAKYGLEANVIWRKGEKERIKALLRNELIPRAAEGLARLQIASKDQTFYLGIIERRVVSGQTGAEWQRRFVAAYPKDFSRMTREYLERQRDGRPVHEWTV